MLDSNKARNVIISLLIAASVLIVGMMLYGRYSQPEFVNHVVVLPDGGIELKQGAANSKYLSGSIRTVVEWFTLIIPSGLSRPSFRFAVVDWWICGSLDHTTTGV